MIGVEPTVTVGFGSTTTSAAAGGTVTGSAFFLPGLGIQAAASAMVLQAGSGVDLTRTTALSFDIGAL